MIKQTVTYTNFENEEVTEDLYFNLNSVEQVRLESKYTSLGFASMDKYLEDLLKKKDSMKLTEFLEELIVSSYGVKSQDNNKFMKTNKIREDFEYSLAYAELFETFLLNPDKFRAFVTGIFTKQGKKPTSNVVVQS